MKKRRQYAHIYRGKKNSRGKRTLSKLHKGMKPLPLDIFDKTIMEYNTEKDSSKK